MTCRLPIVLAVALALVLTPLAAAAQVEVQVSPRETSVGLPVTVAIVIEYRSTYEAPQLPEIDGATVTRVGSQESYQSINGRVTRSITTSFRMTPARAGSITIPSFEIVADGESVETEPVEILVSEVGASATIGGDVELLEAEVEAGRDRIYLGEPLDVTLRIWVRPYRDRRYEITLTDRNMWSLIEREESGWGPFAEALGALEARRQMPRAREHLRETSDGRRSAYYAFEISTRVWPRQAGPLALDPVTVVMQYPTRLERRRRFFNDDLTVAESRPLVVQATPPRVIVEAPPSAGQPETFAGAVGEFRIAATAKPVQVAVGDPITLTLTVTDRTPGGSELELLQPPPLGKVADLTDRFRIPTDPLAGVVEGRVKTFTQTIRARSADVDRIPPIPFSFFRPADQSYETTWTEPIVLDVRAASEMSMAEVVEADGNGPAATTELTQVAGGLLANYTEHDALLASQTLEPGWWVWVLLVVPPLLFAGAAISQRRATRMRHDSAYVRRRVARRNAMDAIRDAARSSAGTAARAEHLATAVRGYVADRCNLPSGALTRTEVTERLRAASLAPDLVEQVETVLSRCEECLYGGSADGDLDELIHGARRAIDRLERERIA